MVLESPYGPLPRGGRLGFEINAHDRGVIIRRVSAGERRGIAGVEAGDRIVSIAGERIDTMEDVRLAMLDRSPGEQVSVELERNVRHGPVTRVRTYLELI